MFLHLQTYFPMIKAFKSTFLIFSVLLLLTTACSTPRQELPDQPNILLILADDLGYNDLGFQGSEDLLTPHIDALAENGVVFTDAHVTASVCIICPFFSSM